MSLLITTIDTIYESYCGEESISYIEDITIDAIIVLAFENLEVTPLRVLDIVEDRLTEVLNSDAYHILKDNASSIDFVNIEVIQTVYEYMIQKEDSKKEKYGIYYTPEWLANYTSYNIFNKTDISQQSLCDFKILEPSCGCGIFISHVFDIMFEYYVANTEFSSCEIAKNIIQNNIYGMDIDEKALRICKYVLMIKAYKQTKVINDYSFNLYNMDYLKCDDIYTKNFDIILGNPPFLENRKINKYYNKVYLKEKYITAKGRFDIYSLFIEKSLDILKANGYLSFILPGNLLSNNNFASIRKLILDKACILEIINLGEGIFNNVGMNMLIISLLKQTDNINNTIRCKNITKSMDKINDISIEKYRYIPQKYYVSTLMNVFDIDSSDLTFKLRERLFGEKYIKINDVSETIAGIATGNIRNKLITCSPDSKNAKKIIEGKNVFNYYHTWGGLYFIDDKSIIDSSKGEYATFMRNEFINTEKILIRQTADRFICSYDDQGYYLLNTLYSLKIRDKNKRDVDIKYVLALLNSKLYSFLYRTLIREEGKLFPQLKIFHIQYSPIIIISSEIQMIIRKMVDTIMLNSKALSQVDSMHTPSACKMQIEIEQTRNSIDKVVYNIFNLSVDEIKEVEKEMGISPLEYEMGKKVSKKVLRETLYRYKDIIRLSQTLKVNPLEVYQQIFDKYLSIESIY